ncbi:MAG: hypothetical protein N2201_03150 [candidate division WOR-3 bacterium]|nr:hypothetical protein [candidate division WOR-3 bacterium]
MSNRYIETAKYFSVFSMRMRTPNVFSSAFPEASIQIHSKSATELVKTENIQQLLLVSSEKNVTELTE